jgi:hypothetical protein
MSGGQFARKAHESLTLALQHPHEMPARAFDRSRLSLWLCPQCEPFGTWNAPERAHCRDCAAPRS